MDILNQRDIDALIAGAAAEKATSAALPYNFLQAPRLARERLKVLEAIHRAIAEGLEGFLSAKLRHPTDVTFSSVELVAFGEYVLSLGAPCAALVFDLGESLAAQAIVDLDARFAPHIVDRLFGGPGEGGEEGRALSPLEQRALTGLTERLAGIIREAWSEHLGMTPTWRAFAANSDGCRIAAPDASVLVATLRVQSGAGRGTMTICVPATALESFLQERSVLPTRNARARSEHDDATRRTVERHLRSAAIPVAVRLPVFALPALEIAALQVGQVLQTGLASEAAVELHVSGRRLFLGALGRHQGKVGVRLTEAAAPADATSRPTRRTASR